MSEFAKDIIKFNQMYGMAVAPVPTLPSAERLENFLKIIRKEVDEGEDILAKLKNFENHSHQVDESISEPARLEILTDFADWFADIQIYCASEMAKSGLPLDPVLDIIMQSNFSKMGADGNPIYDEQGKLQKGPNYWKPEPKINVFLKSLIITNK